MESERDFKATNAHWQVIMDFLEAYPHLAKNKFQGASGDRAEQRKLWEELTMRLNGLGYGAKSTEKWQLAIGRWKSKIKSKATTLRLQQEKTGGGETQCCPLTDIEERLMGVIGWKNVTGDNNREIGMPSRIQIPNIPNNTPNISNSPTTSRGENIPPLNFYDSNKKRKAEENKGVPTKRKIALSTEKSKKFVTISQMMKENKNILENIEGHMKTIADTMQLLRGDFLEYLNVKSGDREKDLD